MKIYGSTLPLDELDKMLYNLSATYRFTNKCCDGDDIAQEEDCIKIVPSDVKKCKTSIYLITYTISKEDFITIANTLTFLFNGFDRGENEKIRR